jgi:hypothetical protein
MSDLTKEARSWFQKLSKEQKDEIFSKYHKDCFSLMLEKQDACLNLIYKIESINKHIQTLEAQSFEVWSEDAINGYLTALTSIKEFIQKD